MNNRFKDVGALTVFMAASLGIAVCLTVVNFSRGTEVERIRALPPPVAQEEAVALDVPQRQEALSALLATPLMYASRAIYTPVVDAPPATPPLPQYRLTGTILVSGKPAQAILAPLDSGTARRIKKGDALDGWEVVEIVAGRVILGFGDQRTEIVKPAGASGSLARVSVAQKSQTRTGEGIRTLSATTSASAAVLRAATGVAGRPVSLPQPYQAPR